MPIPTTTSAPSSGTIVGSSVECAFTNRLFGALNHTCGLKRAQTVVAINNDADALIFERANIGLVADWQSILPALQDAFQRRLE